MISVVLARDVALRLAPEFNARIVEPASARPVLTAIEASVALIPGAGPVLAQVRALLDPLAERVSLAVPTPWETIIVLSPAALEDGPSYLATAAHEFTHAADVQAIGAFQVGADYASPEMRAIREATPCGVGLWVRYLLTGVRPSPDDASVVRSDLYHLDVHDKAFARSVVSSCLAAINTSARPPSRVARRVLEALRAHAPDAILAEEYR